MTAAIPKFVKDIDERLRQIDAEREQHDRMLAALDAESTRLKMARNALQPPDHVAAAVEDGKRGRPKGSKYDGAILALLDDRPATVATLRDELAGDGIDVNAHYLYKVMNSLGKRGLATKLDDGRWAVPS